MKYNNNYVKIHTFDYVYIQIIKLYNNYVFVC